MGPKEIEQMYIRTCVDGSVIVALLAEPPGVNESCVCTLHSWRKTKVEVLGTGLRHA